MSDPLTKQYRTRGNQSNLNFDAYFPDEAGLEYKNGLFLNKYTRIFIPNDKKYIEISQEQAKLKGYTPDELLSNNFLREGAFIFSFRNPLDPSFSSKLRFPTLNIPQTALGLKSNYSAYAPSKLIKEIAEILSLRKQCPRNVKICLFFGTGSELGRHGLRTFIDKTFWRVIIIVPGIEKEYLVAKGKVWGIGISEAQIKEIVKKIFKADVSFVVDRIFGYSTGYNGVADTIRNELIPLRNIEVLGFFDCNYGEQKVHEAIKMLRNSSSSVKVIAYASSQAGTPAVNKHDIQLDINKGGIAWLLGRPEFIALTHARVLASGLNDKTISWSEINKKLHYQLSVFLNSLPERGTVVSEPTIHQLIQGVYSSSNKITLYDWYKKNKGNVDFFLRHLWNETDSLVKLIWKHQLPGWNNVPDQAKAIHFTEGAHDFLVFEFAWEVLG